jgi:hypothetical protein
MMHIRHFFRFLPMVLLCACANVSEPDSETLPTAMPPVGFDFDASAARTRALSLNDTTLNRIGVFGYSHHKADGWTNTAQAKRLPDYFFNKMVVRYGDVWSYDGITKYWPDPARSVTFFAYAPYMDNQGTFELHPAKETDADSPQITYTLPVHPSRQVDLLYDMQPDKTYQTTVTDGTPGVVGFQMKHALSRADVSLRLNNATDAGRSLVLQVHGISFNMVKTKGKLTLDSGNWDTDSYEDFRDDILLTSADGLNPDSLLFDARRTDPAKSEYAYDYRLISDTLNTCMMMPQVLIPGTSLSITYSLTNLVTGETAPYAVYSASIKDMEWKAGYFYHYRLTFAVSNGNDVKVTLIVGEFDTSTGSIKWKEYGGTDAAEGSTDLFW